MHLPHKKAKARARASQRKPRLTVLQQRQAKAYAEMGLVFLEPTSVFIPVTYVRLRQLEEPRRRFILYETIRNLAKADEMITIRETDVTDRFIRAKRDMVLQARKHPRLLVLEPEDLEP